VRLPRCLGGIAASTLLLLAGCSPIDKAPLAEAANLPPSASGRATAEELVQYMAGLRGMGEGALAAEAARQRQAAAGDAGDTARVKAALALTLMHPAEEGEILALVEPVAKRDAPDGDLKTVASFLQVMAIDRRRLRESAAAAGSRMLRDERRAHEVQKQRADALQERAAQLQQKLDALTALEKSLSERQPPSP
jgi:hypothetical protein